MKHYICVEEHEITYVCGAYKGPDRSCGKGTVVIQEWESLKLEGGMQDIFERLSEKYHLEGKKVILALGRDIGFCRVTLPRTGRRLLPSMARGEVIALGKCGADSHMAVDGVRNRGDARTYATVYYMEKKKAERYVSAMEQAGMVWGGIRLIPDCAAVASRIMCKSRASIVVDVENDSLGLYGVSGGHCLAWKCSPLRPGRFLEIGARELLYEEIAEQAGLIQKQMETESGRYAPERIVLTGNCFQDWEPAAAYLENQLGLPCTGAVFHVVSDTNVEAMSPGALISVAAGGRYGRRLLQLESGRANRGFHFVRGAAGAVSRGWALFLAANVLAVLGVCLYVGMAGYQTTVRLSELKAVMDGAEYKGRYQNMLQMDSRMEEEAARLDVEEIVRRAAAGGPELKDFNALIDAMERGTQVESIVYEGDPEVLELLLSMDSDGQVPDYVERANRSGVFERVSHGYWEAREEEGRSRVYAQIRVFLKEGGQDDIQ